MTHPDTDLDARLRTILAEECKRTGAHGIAEDLLRDNVTGGWPFIAQAALHRAYALGAAEKSGEWQPIETYPRDHDHGADTDWGPNALLFIPSGKVAPSSDYRICIGRLEADIWLSYSDDGAMFDLGGTPTHWKPLPTPPQSPPSDKSE